jgi:hypothetical protein
VPRPPGGIYIDGRRWRPGGGGWNLRASWTAGWEERGGDDAARGVGGWVRRGADSSRRVQREKLARGWPDVSSHTQGQHGRENYAEKNIVHLYFYDRFIVRGK